MIAIVDAGPLYAAIDIDDKNHQRCVAVFQRAELDLVIPALVIAEVAYLVEQRLGPNTEAEFLRSLSAIEVEAPRMEDWGKMATLVQRYADFPLGSADASVAILAERLGTDLLITLDRRHFSALRMSDGRAFRLLPD